MSFKIRNEVVVPEIHFEIYVNISRLKLNFPNSEIYLIRLSFLQNVCSIYLKHVLAKEMYFVTDGD